MELKNPFGLRDNKIIMIEDLPPDENGLKCNCICPACHEPFIARMGNLVRHHFAHSGKGCDVVNAYLAGLYMLLCEYLSSGNPLHLPPVIVGFQLPDTYELTEENIENHTWIQSASKNKKNERTVFDASVIIFNSAEIIKNPDGKCQAIIGTLGNKKLAIRIIPPESVCYKTEVKRFQNFPTIEIDLSEAEEIIQHSNKKAFFNYLRNSENLCRWIYNPLISRKYPEICAYSRKHIEKQKEQEKKREEIRRRLAEKQRQLKMLNANNYQILTAEEKEIRYNQGYEEVKDKFTQQHTRIYDKFGVQWVQCKYCKKIAPAEKFGSNGGAGEVNLGICKECNKNPKNI